MLALALAGVPTLATDAPDPMFVNYPEIEFVDCLRGSGTAWRNGVGSFVSVNHVTSHVGCKIDGEPVKVTHASSEMDYSSLRTAIFGMGLKINCEGFKDRTVYLAIGYAEGKPFQRAMFVQASDNLTKLAPWKGFHALFGKERYIPGMSGGPVLNEAGEVVGLVNGFNTVLPISYSQALKDTPLCDSALA
jgi:hypothetical protein